MTDDVIALQVTPDQRAMVDHAARLLGMSRAAFLLQAACQRAQEVVLDHVFFHLDADAVEQFTAVLAETPATHPGLERLLALSTPWGHESPMGLQIAAPEALRAEHRCDDFECGEPILDEWLKHRAMANQRAGTTRTYVVADDRGHVLGYYAIEIGAVARQTPNDDFAPGSSTAMPVIVLAPLGVDRKARGLKLGGALLQDALQRAHAISETAGAVALLVHALSDPSRAFYEHYGFRAVPVTPMTLMLPLRV